MIKRLYIKNLAIIRELQVTFRSGLNIITGETGAGKSILIDSLGLLLGGRISSDIIRTGEQTAVVEGEFSDGRNTLLVRRVIRPGGASRIFLNDEPVKLGDLEERIAPLVDLHGQHEHQSLLRVGTHLDFLDAFAGLMPERARLEQTYQRLMVLRNEFRKLEDEHNTESEKQELRQFQLRELESAKLEPAEEQALTNELQLLSQAGELTTLMQSLDDRLRLADTSIVGELGGFQKQLERYAPLAVELGDFSARLVSLNLELSDLAFELQRFAETVKVNPARLAEVEERLALLEGIKRKYGGSLATALTQLENLREKNQSFTAGDQRLAGLREELIALKADYVRQCQSVSSRRKQARLRLATEIVASLAALDMPKAQFEVRLENVVQEGGACVIDGKAFKSDQRGFDQVEFLLSPNPGEELRPLVKIASGGEISRIMLGIKTVLAAFDPVNTLIFDEIDSGISGSTAETVGAALERLADGRQLICITHLAQIAARGGHHIAMSKAVEQGRTFSRSEVLSTTGRRTEVARLLSGAEITAASREQARLLLAGRAEPEEVASN